MATPRKRMSHGRTRMRRSHDGLKKTHLGDCPQCGTRRLPHTVCATCGTYSAGQKRLRKVFVIAEDVDLDEDAENETEE